MSRSVKVKKPKWTDREDIAYLSFFGTLLQGLRTEDTRLPVMSFELERRGAPDIARTIGPHRVLFPVPARQVTVSPAQRQALKSIASAAEKARYVPRALPGHADTVIIEMEKLSESKEPVYAKRVQ